VRRTGCVVARRTAGITSKECAALNHLGALSAPTQPSRETGSMHPACVEDSYEADEQQRHDQERRFPCRQMPPSGNRGPLFAQERPSSTRRTRRWSSELSNLGVVPPIRALGRQRGIIALPAPMFRAFLA